MPDVKGVNMKVKAAVSQKRRLRGSFSMWTVSALCIIALALIIYNIIMANYWYVACYAIGIILGLSYILVCLNELYSTWIMTDGEDLVLRCWDNCFFPYQTLLKFNVGELLPAKNVRLRVPIGEISKIIIGTKTFIKRNTSDESFLEAVALYENTKYNSNQRLLEKADILYVGTVDNDSVFMSVNDFDAKAVIKLLRVIEKKNPSVTIRVNGKAYRRYISASE